MFGHVWSPLPMVTKQMQCFPPADGLNRVLGDGNTLSEPQRIHPKHINP